MSMFRQIALGHRDESAQRAAALGAARASSSSASPASSPSSCRCSALTRSLSDAVLATGSADRAIVLRGGATGEAVEHAARRRRRDDQGCARHRARSRTAEPAASAEFVTAVNLLRKENGARAGLTVRGVEPAVFSRAARRSRSSTAACSSRGCARCSSAAARSRSLAGVAIGDEVALRDSRWTVVGVFESGGDANESSLMADAATLLSAYQRTAVEQRDRAARIRSGVRRVQDGAHDQSDVVGRVERETDFYRRAVGGGRPDLFRHRRRRRRRSSWGSARSSPR